MRNIILLCILCGLVGVTGADDLTRVKLANEFVAVETVPSVSGMISGFSYLPDKRAMIAPLVCRIERDDLLPEKVEVNTVGGREILWGVKFFYNVPFAILDSGEHRIRMVNNFFQSEAVRAEKSVSVTPGRIGMRIELSLRNHGTKPFTAVLWKNLIAELGTGQPDDILIPVKGGVTRSGTRTLTGFDADTVFVENDPARQEFFLPPGQPWIGRRSGDGTPGVLALRTADAALGENSMFYTYKRSGAAALHTMEMVFAPVEIAPGGTHDYWIDYLYFPHLNGLQTIAGEFGIDRRGGELLLEPVSSAAGGTLTLNGNGMKHSFRLPPQAPGTLARISLPESMRSIRLYGTLPDGTKFSIPGQ